MALAQIQGAVTQPAPPPERLQGKVLVSPSGCSLATQAPPVDAVLRWRKQSPLKWVFVNARSPRGTHFAMPIHASPHGGHQGPGVWWWCSLSVGVSPVQSGSRALPVTRARLQERSLSLMRRCRRRRPIAKAPLARCLGPRGMRGPTSTSNSAHGNTTHLSPATPLRVPVLCF